MMTNDIDDNDGLDNMLQVKVMMENISGRGLDIPLLGRSEGARRGNLGRDAGDPGAPPGSPAPGPGPRRPPLSRSCRLARVA